MTISTATATPIEYPPIMVPTMDELTEDSLRQLVQSLIDSAERWAVDHSANFEYAASTVLLCPDDVAKTTEAFKSFAPISERERIVPMISMKQGSNEGYQVCITLQRSPANFPLAMSLTINAVYCKVWDKETQYALADHFDAVLCW